MVKSIPFLSITALLGVERGDQKPGRLLPAGTPGAPGIVQFCTRASVWALGSEDVPWPICVSVTGHTGRSLRLVLPILGFSPSFPGRDLRWSPKGSEPRFALWRQHTCSARVNEPLAKCPQRVVNASSLSSFLSPLKNCRFHFFRQVTMFI